MPEPAGEPVREPGREPARERRVTPGRVLWLACLVLVWALLLLAGVLDVVAFVASASDTPYQGRADDRTAAWWTLFGLVIPLAFLAAVLTSLERRAAVAAAVRRAVTAGR